MKKILLAMSFLMIGVYPINAMLGKSESRYNPFDKLLVLNNKPQLTDDELIQVIKRGDYDAIEQELLRGLNAKYIFETGEYKGKSLLQLVLSHSISNRKDIAARLLREGANSADLNDFIKAAVKSYDSEMLKWLLAHGAKDNSVYAVVEILEKAAQGQRKQELIKIKELLRPHQVPVTAAAIEKPKARETTQLPVVVVEPVKVRPIKKDDVFTVLAEADEKKLFNALLSGNEQKVAQYLEMGVSPDFVFWKGVPGKSLLQIAATQTLNNQEKIAELLLHYGANSHALQDGLILAVERFDKPKVEWLLAKGAPVTAQLKDKIQELEKNTTHPVKQKKLAEIKTLVEKQRVPVVPAVMQFAKPLPPVPSKKPAPVDAVKISIEKDYKK